MSALISRHIATIGNRQVHYRRAGDGPPVMLLHQSPTSSREYIPLITELAKDFTVFSPDTPGNGLSDPLQIETITMSDLADAVVSLLDELGLDKVPVYGFHTGALCALELARRHPERIVVSVVNGYIQMDEATRKECIDHYFARLDVDWSGSHLAWVWARMREQYIFFPWFKKDSKSRVDFDIPNADHINGAVMEILRAGDNYQGPYRSAFLYDTKTAVQEAKARTIVMCARSDVLFSFFEIMPETPDCVSKFPTETHEDSEKELIQLFKEYRSSAAVPSVAPTKPIAGKVWRECFTVNGGTLYAHRNTDGKGRPIVIQHASAGSSATQVDLMEALIGKRPVIAFDMPGNGESDRLLGDDITVAQQANYLAQGIRAAGYDEVDIVGEWGGGAVAVELAAQKPDLVKHVALPHLVALDDATRKKYKKYYTPPIEIDDYGGHMLKAWIITRDQELYAPWFEHKIANIIRSHEPRIEPEHIHQRTLDLLKCADIYDKLYGAHYTYPILDQLKRLACPILVGDPDNPATQKAAALNLTGFKTQELPYVPGSELAAALLDFFETA